jgi:hypothetical protein
MDRNLKIKLFWRVLIVVLFALGMSAGVNAQARKIKATNHDLVTQQPLYTEYRGVSLGMSADETRVKLGQPAMKNTDQDFYVFSENESAQIVYDRAQKVVTISVDYLGGIGAPDYRAVVGGELETEANGTVYKMMRYDSLGFWVSYNRTKSPVATVTLTIQRIL